MTEDLSVLGLNFIVGLSGPALLPEEAVLLESLKPAGIILFAKNIDSAAPDGRWQETLARLIRDASQAAGRSAFLVSVDHEGGRVHRFPAPVTHFPHASAWCDESRAVGRAMGRELRSLGFNLNFAPVLDVHSEPQNPVIGVRAFGESPKSVADFALPFALGMEEEGVLSCGKHFPGHGATTADSHLELPHLDVSAETIAERDLLPFIEYIKRGYRLLMTAHVLYPVLDSRWPATLSRIILTELLRDRLGFHGAVVSDDLEMAALKTLPPGERALRALDAGVDLLLEGYPKDAPALWIAAEMARGVLRAVEAGLYNEARIVASQLRVQRLLEAAQALQRSAGLSSSQILGCPAHSELCSRLQIRTATRNV